MLAKRLEVAGLVRMDRQREGEALIGALWQLEEPPQRMGFLAVVNALVLDRAIRPPVSYGGESIALDRARDRPPLDDDGRQRVNPIVSGFG